MIRLETCRSTVRGDRRSRSVITAYLGGDPTRTTATVDAWAELTTGGFALETFPGDHLYLVPEQERLLAAVTARLR
ncbi:hypothetical protein ABZ793_19000 [Micromonospora sp. NPDC047465]|uniref:hypothetical protein n=1 Tax=Micromonospora sp. NPDC047465 TaxID=3154813 RepID=UPI003410A062